MKYISTRGFSAAVSSAEAIINGIADDGGLYVPNYIPNIYNELTKFQQAKYEKLAYEIMRRFFDDFTDDELKEAISLAYKNRFSIKVDNVFLELYHGPTSAFKDAALLFLPQIMKKAKEKLGIKDNITILTATSGDTGKAALEGFKGIEGFNVVVYYPKDGVSDIQEKQMRSAIGDNLKVIGIKGNFDNAQSGVKRIFGDKDFQEKLQKSNIRLSSANSINIGRLIPQIVYYFYGYFSLVNNEKIKNGDEINVVVPTGNFGNILAAYYAKKMGLPIDKLICASNENNVLSDFFNTGIYDRRRELKLTESPSMDILVSSNIERLIFEVCNRNGEYVKTLMNSLNTTGIYKISHDDRVELNDFYANFATEEEVHNAIRKVYNDENYLMDTHTAVAYVVLNKYIEKEGNGKKNLVVATASPYKFPRSICKALKIEVGNLNDFQLLKILNSYTNKEIPNNLNRLYKSKIYHYDVCDVDDMSNLLEKYLFK